MPFPPPLARFPPSPRLLRAFPITQLFLQHKADLFKLLPQGHMRNYMEEFMFAPG